MISGLKLATAEDVNLADSTAAAEIVSLLKASAKVMAPLYTCLANLSFAAGVFPASYKIRHVIPLLKKTGLNKENPVN